MKTKKAQKSVFAWSLIALVAVAGCAQKKNPVGDDLKTIREQGKTATEMGPQKPVTVTKTQVVEKPVIVKQEESTIDDKFLVITPDPQMSFNEGQKTSYKIRARVLIPGVQIKLVAQDLPSGAVLEESKSEKDLYVLTWTPELYTIAANANMKLYAIKVRAEILSTSTPSQAEKLKAIVREKEIPLFLFKNQELPSELKVAGLTNEVTEGSEPISFSVTVKIPGMDDKAPQKPRLVVSYDGVSFTAGNSFLELDGSRYVPSVSEQKGVEYLGNFQWKFTRVFDVKNIPVQPQLSKDGTVLAGADGTRVRMSLKVYNAQGLSTPEKLIQLKIKYNKAGK